MGPLRHAALAAGSAAAFFHFSRNRTAAAIVLASGTLIDADHLVDYVLSEGFRWNLPALRSGNYFRNSGRALVLLHSYELVILAVALIWRGKGGRARAAGLLAGVVPHLASDLLTYGFPPLCYSLGYRALHGFRLSAFRPQASGGSYEEPHP